MATRSLGQLTLDLVAKVGGFVQGMDKAERSSSKFRKSVEADFKAIRSSFLVVGTAFIGAMTLIGKNTIDAGKEQAQLAAALRSTGNAAGFTQAQLNKMGAELSDVTTLSTGDITKAQTALLTYSNIVGNNFVRAQKAAADMSVRLGMDLVQSAETVGKALDTPSKGMNSLSKQGFRFGEEQVKLAKHLEETGRIAEAQAIVLDALEESYKGSATAARNTFGGALEGVKNSLRDLLTGDEGSLDNARTAVEALNLALKDPTVKVAVSELISTTLSGTTKIVENIGFVADAVEGVKRVFELAGSSIALFALGVKADMLLLTKWIYDLPINAVNTLIDGLNLLPTINLDRIQFGKKSQELGAELKYTQEAIALGLKDMEDKFLSPLPSQRITHLREEAARANAELGKISDTASKSSGYTGDSVAFLEMMAKLKERLGLIGKVTDAEQLEYRVNNNLIKDITHAEGMRLVAVQKRIDTEQKAYDDKVKAAKDAADEIDRINKEAKNVARSLDTEEEQIQRSYEERRKTILSSTELTEREVTDLLTRLEKERRDKLEKMEKKKPLEAWIESAQKALENFEELSVNVINNFSSGVGNAFESMIFDSKNLNDAMYNMANGIARSFINAVGQMIGQWLALKAVMGIGSIFSAGASVTTSWAGGGPVANAATGGLVGGIGTSTSDSNPFMLSKGEFVVNAASTADNLPLLRAINEGKTFSHGSPKLDSAVAQTRQDDATKGITVHYENYGTSKSLEAQQISPDEIRLIARDEVMRQAPRVVAAEMKNPNSVVSKSITNNTNAKRMR